MTSPPQPAGRDVTQQPLTPSAERPAWVPDGATIERSNIEQFRRWLAQRHSLNFADYQALQRWSVQHDEQFWTVLLDYFDIPRTGCAIPARRGDTMPMVTWFPGVKVNYVDQVMSHADHGGVAIIDAAEPGGPAAREISWTELRRQVAAVAAHLKQHGVARGDRVVGYLPNIPEAVIALLATASIGAVWSSCGQDYSAPGAVDRLGQLEPVALITADGYRYAGRDHDRCDAVVALRDGLPNLRTTVVVERLGCAHSAGLAGVTAWSQASAGQQPLSVAAVPFEHPLWVLFSSGTTGRPKGIVHGHGGVVLEHLKQMAFHLDLQADDTYFWYTSPSWMMWNFQVAGLLVGATIVTYDGSPAYPHADALWALADRHQVAVLGTSPAYLQECEKAHVAPKKGRGLTHLRTLGATGSVLTSATYSWVAEVLGPQVALASTTGGTDVVSAFAGFVPTEPIWPGEISAACLGVALQARDPVGRPVIDDVGELVITQPLPSMPLFFWNDPDGARYRDAYFDIWPGVWRHGDWITVTRRGTLVVHGRSDSTLNRNGVRMGSADIYQAVEKLPEVADSLVLGVEYPDGSYWMPLFVVLAGDAELDQRLHARIRATIRDSASPKHIPDDIIAVPGVPRTRTGKKLEVPLKRLMQGGALSRVVDPQAVDDKTLLDVYAAIAAQQVASREGLRMNSP